MPNAGSATMYTSGWPKNQNRCWNRIGLPPLCVEVLAERHAAPA